MKIHCTSKFEGLTFNYHDAFDIAIVEKDLENFKNKIVNLALEKMKFKCDYFKVKFESMNFFEVYYYNEKGKEIELFKKVKE